MTLLFEDATPTGDEAAHNLYFALQPDAEAAGALCALEGLRITSGRPMDPDQVGRRTSGRITRNHGCRTRLRHLSADPPEPQQISSIDAGSRGSQHRASMEQAA